MKQLKILIFIFTLMTKTTSGQLTDASFQQYCQLNGKRIGMVVDANTPNPQGHRCEVVLSALPARDLEEAEYHCKRWSAYVLVKTELFNLKPKCTYENVYHCKSGYTQIRGMCYKDMGPTLKTYEEAKSICAAESNNERTVRVFKLHEFHLAELMEEYMTALSMYFMAPDKGLEDVHTFVNGTGPHYVLLFSWAIHFQTGTYSIVKFKEQQKAFVMCEYQPPETILSFKYKAEKLGVLYHPTLLSGLTTVWRTASMYTRTNLPKDGKDVCEKSLKALTGTEDGTFFNLDPQYTKIFTDAIRKSFVVAFAPFEHCRWSSESVGRVYFKHKGLKHTACDKQANIIGKNYNAQWRKNEHYGDAYSFVYYPQTVGGNDMERKRGAYYGPMLCGIHMIFDVHQPECDDWVLYERGDRYVCHKWFGTPMSWKKAYDFCRTKGATIAMWTSHDEFKLLVGFRNTYGGDVWAGCYSIHGCSSVEGIGASRAPDMRSSYNEMYKYDSTAGQYPICTKYPS